MKNFYSLFLVFLFSFQLIHSQNPVTFTTSVNKISENHYELVTSSEIENEWRLYSQFLIDGGAIPTEFIFKNNEKSSFELIGQMKESESITKYDPVFKIDQTYFINANTFKQEIKVNDYNTDKIYATIIYQSCNDYICIYRESELLFNLDGSIEDAVNEDLTTLILDDNNPLKLDLKNKE
ncbi:MAG: thiol:disulfide interchange protein, partial [Flavobacteriaceae bacterium]|nr:thiol:disulfide interchange protein [Flavobacteriaceae bacterium]